MNTILETIISWFLVLFGVSFPIYLLFKVIGIRGFENLTKYVEGKTFFHRLNPLTKLIPALYILIAASQSIWIIGLADGLILLPFFYKLKRLKLVLAFSLSQVFGMTWGFAVFTSPSVLQNIFGKNLITIWEFPSYFAYLGYVPDLTIQALFYGLQVAMRIWGMLLFSLIILLTTTVSEFTRALSKFKFPQSLIFSIIIAVISIPRIFEIAEMAYKLQLMRGISYNKPRIVKPFYKALALFYSILPTIIFLFKKARITGISAETRAFGVYKSRTFIEDYEFSLKDKILLISGGILTIIDLYFVVTGVIPAIPYHLLNAFR